MAYTIALLGSSNIAGRGQAFDIIGELAKRPENAGFRFLNFGIGGDLAYNALQRVPSVVAERPDSAVLMIGGNDILASVFHNVWRIFRRTKHLPRRPSPGWFSENLRAIVQNLKSNSVRKIAIVSLPQIGEDPSPSDAAQRQLNALYEEYASIIKQIATEERAVYVPFYETFRKAIEASPGRAFTSFRFLPFYRDTLRFFILRQTSEKIAEANGWKFHVDGIHLNRRGGLILASLLQEFLSSAES